MPRLTYPKCLVGFLTFTLLTFASHGETVTIPPNADTTLSAFFPNNNFGSSHHLMAGGLRRTPRAERMLLQFDIATHVPAGATITSVALSFTVTRTPSAAPNSTFLIRRVNGAWIEGTGGSTLVADKGTLASGGSATWNTPFPGGGTIGTHYSSTESASLTMAGTTSYTFVSNPTLVSDVQNMLDSAESNFGWMLTSNNEDVSKTVRRIGSRENPTAAPSLEIEFETAPTPPLTVTLTATEDNSLFEFNPDNNLGGMEFLAIGTTANNTKSRGLFKFDLSSVPANSTILDAEFNFNIVFIPEPAVPLDYQIHRVLQDWGEGTGTGLVQGVGLGRIATPGESSWNNRLAPSTAWNAPGAESGTDYVSIPSGTGTGTIGVTTIASTELASDVQSWVNDAASNFGWLLKLEEEDSYFPPTARRIGSRESLQSSEHPTLTITWDVPPPVISDVKVVDGQICFDVSVSGGRNYDVLARTSIDAPPTIVATIDAQATDTTVQVCVDQSGSMQFFQVVAP